MKFSVVRSTIGLSVVCSGMFVSQVVAAPIAGLTRQAQEEAYRIAARDVLKISVQSHPEFNLESQVQPDGTISYFALGKIVVAGKTTIQVEEEIAAGLKKAKLLVRPRVNIALLREKREVSITGAVKSSAKLELRDGWRVLDALGAVGGIGTDRYEFYKAQIVRGAQLIPLDLEKIYAGNLEANLLLQNLDTVIILEKDAAEITIQLIGEIGKDGRGGVVPCPRDGSIISVLNTIGGVTPDAALSKAHIERKGQTINLDLRGYKKGRLDTTERLQPGDRLIVPKIEDRYKVIGGDKSGELTYPEDRTLTLFDVLTQSSLLNQSVDLKKVKITRVSDKTTIQMTRDVRKMLDGDMTDDLTIQPGDTIFVPTKSTRRTPSVTEVLGAVTGLASAYFFLRNISNR